MAPAFRKIIKRRHYPIEEILVCVALLRRLPLSLRHIEEMMPSAT